jgi:glycosyltransferase involved in cell wall biosynthesis
MACGTPIVASDTAIFREIAGSAAIYFDPHDPKDLARAIEQSLDKPTGKTYQDRGLLHVARYSWGVTAAKTVATYRAVLGLRDTEASLD